MGDVSQTIGSETNNNAPVSVDCEGPITSRDYNFIGDPSGCNLSNKTAHNLVASAQQKANATSVRTNSRTKRFRPRNGTTNAAGRLVRQIELYERMGSAVIARKRKRDFEISDGRD